MAYYRTTRGSVWIGPEDTTTPAWGGGSSSLEYLKTQEVTTAAGQGVEYSEITNITQEDVEDQGSYLTVPGDITLKTGLHPWSNTWPTAKPVDGNEPPISNLLESVFGGVNSGGYGVTSAGNTADVLQFDPYDPLDDLGFAPGDMIFVRNPGAANIIGANVIKSIDTGDSEITLRSPLPSIPENGAIVYGGYSFAKLPAAQADSYEIEYRGEATTDVRQHLACVPTSLTIDAPYRGQATISVTYRSAAPTPMDVDESGGNPDTQTYPYPEASQVLGGLSYYVGTNALKFTGGISITAEIEAADVNGIWNDDPNGIANILMMSRKVRVVLTPAYEDNHVFDSFRVPNAISVLTGWFGRGAAVWGFQIPQALFVAAPAFGDESGVLTTETTWGCGAYSGDTVQAPGTIGAGDPGDKSFVIAMLAGD